MKHVLLSQFYVAMVAFVGSADAALIGSIVLTDAGLPTYYDGVPTSTDVYNIVITGTTNEVILGLDFTSVNDNAISGMLQQGPRMFSTVAELEDVGVLLADSFFVSPKANPTAAQMEDYSDLLGATYAFATSPVDTSLGYTAAVVSVPAGAPAPVIRGAGAVVQGLPGVQPVWLLPPGATEPVGGWPSEGDDGAVGQSAATATDPDPVTIPDSPSDTPGPGDDGNVGLPADPGTNADVDTTVDVPNGPPGDGGGGGFGPPADTENGSDPDTPSDDLPGQDGGLAGESTDTGTEPDPVAMTPVSLILPHFLEGQEVEGIQRRIHNIDLWHELTWTDTPSVLEVTSSKEVMLVLEPSSTNWSVAYDGIATFGLDTTIVQSNPEPASIAMLALAGVVGLRRRRYSRHSPALRFTRSETSKSPSVSPRGSFFCRTVDLIAKMASL